MSGEEAVAWVDKYRKLLERMIGRFITNSPYDLEDYIQDAYEAALIAAPVSDAKNISFSSAFKMIFRRNALRVTPCTRLTKRSSSVSMSVCDYLEYQDDFLYGQGNTSSSPESLLISCEEKYDDREEFLLELLDHLTLIERRVLVCVAGLAFGRMSYPETASYLNLTEGAVAQTMRRITRKGVLFREKGLGGSAHASPGGPDAFEAPGGPRPDGGKPGGFIEWNGTMLGVSSSNAGGLHGAQRGKFVFRYAPSPAAENGKRRADRRSPGR